MRETRLLHVAGTRPDFMKVAPVTAAVDAWKATKLPRAGEAARRASDLGRHFSQSLVHTGQYGDDAMSDVFCRDLSLPTSDHCLEVGSGGHAQQTAGVLRRLLAERPDLLVEDAEAALLCAAELRVWRRNDILAHDLSRSGRILLHSHVSSAVRRCAAEQLRQRRGDGQRVGCGQRADVPLWTRRSSKVKSFVCMSEGAGRPADGRSMTGTSSGQSLWAALMIMASTPWPTRLPRASGRENGVPATVLQ